MKLEASQMIPVLFSSIDTYATSMLVTECVINRNLKLKSHQDLDSVTNITHWIKIHNRYNVPSLSDVHKKFFGGVFQLTFSVKEYNHFKLLVLLFIFKNIISALENFWSQFWGTTICA